MASFLTFARKYIWVLFLLFLAIDVVQSNYHYSNLPIDGDLPRVAAPFKWCEDVMNDPLGIQAITENKKYSGAGRYVCHKSTEWWFDKGFNLIAQFTKDNVQAIFMTSTVLVALIHLCFLWLVLQYTKTKAKWTLRSASIILLLASVLIQYNGYYDCVGIIDRSITYAIFYALPIMLLLIYFLPFYKYERRTSYKVHWWQHTGLILLAPILAFGCPLTQPIVFIIVLLYFVGIYIPNPLFRIKKHKGLILQLVFLTAICIYTFYVSQYNIESEAYRPLGERYVQLLKGLYRIFTLQPAWPILLTFIIVNCLIFYKNKSFDWKKLKPLLFFTMAFCTIYILLLPLGGYRVYRPYIVRYDTFIPVTLGAFFLLLYTTNHIFNKLSNRTWAAYCLILISFIAIFFIADSNVEKEANYCQQGTFYEIEKSNKSLIEVPINCNVMTWHNEDAFSPEHLEGINIMLRKWGLISKDQQVVFYEPN